MRILRIDRGALAHLNVNPEHHNNDEEPDHKAHYAQITIFDLIFNSSFIH